MSHADGDPELERLVADMSVAQGTPAHWRGNGGVRNEAGTFDDNSTLSGNPITVFSAGHDVRPEADRVEVPIREVTMSEAQDPDLENQTSNGKGFKVFVVPSLDKGFLSFCFQYIGQGASFCTARNCTTSHHNASVRKVMLGELYVAKSTTTAFVTPSIMGNVIDDDVLSMSRTLSLSLPEWNEKFLIATAASDDEPASKAAMEVQEDFFCNKALNFKTPAKRKHGPDNEQSLALFLLDVSPYLPFFKEDKEAPITEIGHVSGVLACLDQGVTSNNEAIIHFIEEYRQEHGKAADAH
jgi:hypothetical protein